jgi:hypothetical protein
MELVDSTKSQKVEDLLIGRIKSEAQKAIPSLIGLPLSLLQEAVNVQIAQVVDAYGAQALAQARRDPQTAFRLTITYPTTAATQPTIGGGVGRSSAIDIPKAYLHWIQYPLSNAGSTSLAE